MKKCSSIVWRFFERIEENSRCVAVVCKLCETQYKYFGNTTNLRAHLTNKHPIQWDLSQNSTLEDSQFRIIDEDSSTPVPQKRRKYGTRSRKDQNVRYSVSVNKEDPGGSGIVPKIEIQRVDVLANSDSDNDEDNDATANLVRQMHGIDSEVEWLDEDPYQITHIETYEPKTKKMKYKKIKREVTSPVGLPSYYVTPQPKKRVVVEDTKKKDEYSVFGEYIANKLRKFNSPRTRGNLQQLITTILWQAEYGFYDNADAVKKVLMYTVQSPEETSTIEYVSQVQNIQNEEIIEHREEVSDSNQNAELEINYK